MFRELSKATRHTVQFNYNISKLTAHKWQSKCLDTKDIFMDYWGNIASSTRSFLVELNLIQLIDNTCLPCLRYNFNFLEETQIMDENHIRNVISFFGVHSRIISEPIYIKYRS